MKELLESWQINQRINLYLLQRITWQIQLSPKGEVLENSLLTCTRYV